MLHWGRMNPGAVSQYTWPLALAVGGLVLFAAALLVARARGATTVAPWTDSAAAAPPDDAALQSVLALLLALATIAGTAPLFATAYVYRWFQSARVLVLVLAALAALAAPVLLSWRLARVAPAGAPAPAPRIATNAALLVTGLIVTALTAAGYRDPRPPAMLALLVLGLPALVMLIGAAGLAAGEVAERGFRLAVLAHWAVCGAALVLATLAVALTAQTLDLALLAQAQANTVWYALGQPAAAAAYLLASVAAAHAASRAVLGPAGRLRRAAELALLLALGALFAAVFLGGTSGPLLPGAVWLALKALAAALAVAASARAVSRGDAAAPARLAWPALALAWLDVAGTVIVLGLRGAA